MSYSRPERFKLLGKMSDEDLMLQFQEGTVAAYQILVERYTDRLLRFTGRFIRDSGTREDIIQETFLRVYRNRHSYRQIAKFSTWLYTITRNLAFSEYRKNKTRTFQSLDRTSSNGESYELDIPDGEHSPEHLTDLRQQVHFLHKALAQLSKPFREVVILRDVQQLTYAEIVEITGLPAGTVKSRIHRGRSTLKRHMEKLYPSEIVDTPECDAGDRPEIDSLNVAYVVALHPTRRLPQTQTDIIRTAISRNRHGRLGRGSVVAEN